MKVVEVLRPEFQEAHWGMRSADLRRIVSGVPLREQMHGNHRAIAMTRSEEDFGMFEMLDSFWFDESDCLYKIYLSLPFRSRAKMNREYDRIHGLLSSVDDEPGSIWNLTSASNNGVFDLVVVLSDRMHPMALW